MVSIKEKQKRVNEQLFGKSKEQQGRETQNQLQHHIHSIKRKRKLGWCTAELARKYNVKPTVMLYFLHKNGIYVAPHKQIPRSLTKKVIKKYKNHVTQHHISLELHIPINMVERIIYRSNVNKHYAYSPEDNKQYFKTHLHYYYNQLYVKQHLSIRDIAKKAGINRNMVRVTFIKNNLPRRPSNLAIKKQKQETKTQPQKPVSLVNLVSTKFKDSKDKIKELQKRCLILSKVIVQQSNKLKKDHMQQEKLKEYLRKL